MDDQPLSAAKAKGVGRDNTYNFLQVALAEESVCDFDRGGGHDYTMKVEGVLGWQIKSRP